MNIKQAKQEIVDTVQAYLLKNEYGEYVIPRVHQRPVLLLGAPGIGKTQIMEQAARECKVALVAYTITHHTRQSAIGLPFISKKEYGGKEYSATEYTMRGPGRVGPMLVPLMISNMAAGNVSIAYGLKGKSLNVVTACATGTHSIGEAYRTIQYGDADVMIAGGTESSITPIGIAGFSALTALSFSEDPERASIPFDKERNGFVMGEGSAIVVLEELEHAKKRGAKIYAELIGYGCSSDAYHITSPAEDGSGAATAMLNALKDGGVAPEELTYINAHGTSTHHNDLFETRAIKLAFGEHAYDLKINSTKSMVGHLLGAAGAVEFVTCVKEIQEGYIHRTVGLRETEEELDLNYCRDSYEEEVPYALTNSLGFGGHNASLLLKKYIE